MAEQNKEANPFTVYYAQLLHQGNMLQDYVRTGTYRHAFMSNTTDFTDKVVLDVGTGTGILALFAVQAGARKVYAVEASESADVARTLVAANGYADKIEIIQGKLEEINLPEQVDIIISEPIGFLLVHERMLETYAVARERFLKPGEWMDGWMDGWAGGGGPPLDSVLQKSHLHIYIPLPSLLPSPIDALP